MTEQHRKSIIWRNQDAVAVRCDGGAMHLEGLGRNVIDNQWHLSERKRTIQVNCGRLVRRLVPAVPHSIVRFDKIMNIPRAIISELSTEIQSERIISHKRMPIQNGNSIESVAGNVMADYNTFRANKLRLSRSEWLCNYCCVAAAVVAAAVNEAGIIEIEDSIQRPRWNCFV